MKPIEELLSELRRLEIKLWIDNDRLRYSAPHGTISPDLLEQMRSRKGEILAFLEQFQPNPSAPIKPVPRTQNIPLSFAQQRLWFLDQLEGKSSAYNMPMALRLKGNLNVAALQQALQSIIERHENLRTNFATQNGAPITIIHSYFNLSLPLINLQNLSETEQEIELEKLINKEHLQPFDLKNDCLIRGTLLRLQDQNHILLLTLHHIISDGWSMNLLRQELGTLYSAFSNNQPSPLPNLPIQYADFAYWQQEWLTREIYQKHLSYWKKQLDGAPPLLELPLDYARPTLQTFTGKKHSQHLSKCLSETLKTLSQNEGVTLFMTLLAAFNVLLYRYTGTEDILVGTPVAGRNRSEVEPLIGFFINTLVLRTDLKGNPSFQELLSRVKEVTLGAYEHQEMPFEKLVEELQPERSLSYNPLFQVWFNMVNLKFKPLELPDLTVELLSSSEAASKFDITLYVREQSESITLDWVYNRELFNPETITGMAERFQTLLESIIAAPDQSISNLCILSQTEHQRGYQFKSRVCLDKPFTEFPKTAIDQSISDRFSEQVNQYPDHIAIHTKNHQWTYRRLNDQANAIAQTLQQRCGENYQRIALLLEQDAPAIAAILGVLKSGKTYIPLDPSYPRLRLTYNLEDSQATAILTNNTNLAFAQQLTSENIHLINIDEIDLENAGDQINLSVSPDTPAYILYTSGSTGQPKGVVQNHRNVLHFIRNYTNNLHIAPDDKLTLLASYSFDAAVMDIFAALLNGATLCPFDIKAEGFTKLSQWLTQQKITIYHSTPTVYRHFIDGLSRLLQSEKLAFPQIRLVVLGGEEVVKKDVELSQNYFSKKCILVNGYGCTESSFNLLHLINHDTVIPGQAVPVGYPFEETEILLLNHAGINAQIYGEIAIRSSYIALEYWQKPELTQAVFLPDPDGGNRRIYRTGDLGRLRPNGTIEFLGRRDFQVKLRGFRIELGEIETTLLQYSAVRETIVIASPDNFGNKQLVAYVVPQSESIPTSLELRNFLKDRLPHYMVPATFVMLDALPLTPNGKVNRRALPKPDVTKLESEDTAIAPRNELELQLIKIWENVLKTQPISILDNFFELGGHSLLAVQLFSEINKIIGQDLPIATLFQAPTVEELAHILRQKEWSPSWSSLVPIKPEGSKPPFFFHGGAADAMTWAKFGRQLAPDQPFYGLQLPALDGKHEFQSSVEEIAADCLKEIRTVQPNGPYFIGGHCFGGTVAFEIAQQLHAQGEKVAWLALVDAYSPKSVPNNSLSLRIQALVHKWDFLLYKTYYYHVDELRKRSLIGKVNYMIDWLGKKAKFKLNSRRETKRTKSQNSANLKASSNHKVSEQSQNSSEFVSHEIRYIEAHKANRAAKAKYSPQVYPGCITLFRAKKQTLEWYFGQKLGWEELVAGGVECYEIPGLFGNLFNQSSLPILIEKVKMCLEEAQIDTRKSNSPSPN